MITFSKSQIRLKKGFTYQHYIVKRNESKATYAELCESLGLTLTEARAIYDRVYNIPLSKIGKVKRNHAEQKISNEIPPLRSKNFKLEYLPSGVDMQKARLTND